jgi:predicted nucleic acid-binding protein
MMSVFIDTSAFLALLDRDEVNHTAASAIWKRLLADDETLVATNYILVESYALIQSRIGLDAVRTFTTDFVPLLEMEWVGADVHATAVSALLVASRRDLSLVDCVSFETMRRRGISRAFAFDRHFKTQGFDVTSNGDGE